MDLKPIRPSDFDAIDEFTPTHLICITVPVK